MSSYRVEKYLSLSNVYKFSFKEVNIMFAYLMAQDSYLYGPILYNPFFMTTNVWIPRHEEIIVLPLVLLLSFKVILRKSKLWGKSLATSLNIAIYPLVLIYGAMVFFKVAKIVSRI